MTVTVRWRDSTSRLGAYANVGPARALTGRAAGLVLRFGTGKWLLPDQPISFARSRTMTTTNTALNATRKTRPAQANASSHMPGRCWLGV